MAFIGSFLVKITACSIFCGIITSITGSKGILGKMTKLLCGIFIAVTLISSLLELRNPNWESFTQDIAAEGDRAAQAGTQYASESYHAIIKDRTKAYILDKAKAWDADISVEISVSAEGIPRAATIRGDLSPYARRQLASIMESDLGIAKEAQQWIGNESGKPG